MFAFMNRFIPLSLRHIRTINGFEAGQAYGNDLIGLMFVL